MYFLFINYLVQKRCHLVFYIFFLLFFSCDSNPSSNLHPENQKYRTKKGEQLVKDGEVVVYHQNGQLQSVGHFDNGVPNGSIIVYDSNGNELYRGLFKNGKPYGEWVFKDVKRNSTTRKFFP